MPQCIILLLVFNSSLNSLKFKFVLNCLNLLLIYIYIYIYTYIYIYIYRNLSPLSFFWPSPIPFDPAQFAISLFSLSFLPCGPKPTACPSHPRPSPECSLSLLSRGHRQVDPTCRGRPQPR